MLVYGHLDTRQLNQQQFDKNTIVSFQTDTFKNDTGQILPTLFRSQYAAKTWQIWGQTRDVNIYIKISDD